MWLSLSTVKIKLEKQSPRILAINESLVLFYHIYIFKYYLSSGCRFHYQLYSSIFILFKFWKYLNNNMEMAYYNTWHTVGTQEISVKLRAIMRLRIAQEVNCSGLDTNPGIPDVISCISKGWLIQCWTKVSYKFHFFKHND